MAGDMKSFFDKGLSIRGKIEGKPAAAFTSGGGNSETALASLERMIGSYRLEKAVDGIIQSGELTNEVLVRCKAMGKALVEAAMKKTAEPSE
jgi:multimeric flavodoxin WrbA